MAHTPATTMVAWLREAATHLANHPDLPESASVKGSTYGTPITVQLPAHLDGDAVLAGFLAWVRTITPTAITATPCRVSDMLIVLRGHLPSGSGVEVYTMLPGNAALDAVIRQHTDQPTEALHHWAALGLNDTGSPSHNHQSTQDDPRGPGGTAGGGIGGEVCGA